MKQKMTTSVKKSVSKLPETDRNLPSFGNEFMKNAEETAVILNNRVHISAQNPIMNPSTQYSDQGQIQSVGLQSSFKVQMSSNMSPLNLYNKSSSV